MPDAPEFGTDAWFRGLSMNLRHTLGTAHADAAEKRDREVAAAALEWAFDRGRYSDDPFKDIRAKAEEIRDA